MVLKLDPSVYERYYQCIVDLSDPKTPNNTARIASMLGLSKTRVGQLRAKLIRKVNYRVMQFDCRVADFKAGLPVDNGESTSLVPRLDRTTLPSNLEANARNIEIFISKNAPVLRLMIQASHLT